MTLSANKEKVEEIIKTISITEIDYSEPIDECLNNNHYVIEGFRNSSSIKELGDYYKIEMPICNSVFRILYNGTPCNEVLTNLLERDLPDKEIAFYF